MFTFALLDPNFTMWRGGVEGGAGYSWPRNELASSFFPFFADPNAESCPTVLRRLLTRYGLAQAYSLSHSLYHFLLSTDSFLLVSCPLLSRAAKERTLVV